MDPTTHSSPSFETSVPQTGGEAVSAAPEQAPQPSVSMPQPAVAPASPPPIPSTPPAASPTFTPPPIATPALTTPAVADDLDLIEKEWVDKAKSIVARTRSDPYSQNKEMNQFKADYMKKRYNKDIRMEP